MRTNKIKRLISLLIVAAITLSTVHFPLPVFATVTLVENNFEVHFEGWTTDFGSLTALEVFDGGGMNGSRGMKISNRQSPENFAISDKGFYLWEGENYTYSVFVRHEEPQNEKFSMTLQWAFYDENDRTESTVIAEKIVAPGEWTELTARFATPKKTHNPTIILATDSAADFWFDDFTVTQKKLNLRDEKILANTPANIGLKDIYANHFRVGNILNGTTSNNSAIRALMILEYNSITAENEHKPDATMNRAASTNTNIAVQFNAGAARINAFCADNAIPLREHALSWHGQTPDWFFLQTNAAGQLDATNYRQRAVPDVPWATQTVMNQRLESYIRNKFARYASEYPNLRIYAVDVVNEYVRVTGSGGAPRLPGFDAEGAGGQQGSQPGHSAWTAIYHGTAANPSAINWAGTIANTNNWLWRAFHYARQYAPEGASLFYNDYNEFDPAKRDYIINNILIPLRERGIIDGMGMQGHISANPDGNSWSGWTRFQTAMDRYAATGLQVQITELDITLETLESGGTRWTPAQQATYYERIFNHAITINSRNGGKVTAICMWGPNDANSWITRRTGRERCAPLLHDGTNTRKPAYNSVAAIVPQSQWGDGKNPNFSWENNGGAPILPDERGYFFHTTFEGSTTSLDGWAARGAATVTNSGTRAFAGTRSAAVTTRTSAWHGIQRELNPRAFVPGNAYGFSAMAMFRDTASTTNQVFALTMNYTDTAGDSRFTRIASAEAAPNEWVRLLNPNFLIPSGARNIFIYIEMVDSTVDFFVDELIGALPNILIPREWVWCLSEATQSEVSDGANAHDVVFSRWGTNTGITLTPQKTLVVSPRPGQTDAAVFNFSQAGMNISTTNYKIHMAGNFSPAAGNFRIQGIVGGPGTGSAVAGALEFTDNVARLHNVSLASGRFDVELTIGPNAEIRPGPYTASSITGNLTALRMHTNANGAGSAITFDTFRVTETSASAPTFTVTFDPNGGTRTGGGQLSQTVAQNSAATAPVLTRQNWVFNGWNSAFNAVTANTTVTAQWLRLGAVSSDGTGTVTSADAVWLARSLAGHTGFSLPASGALREIADINRDGQVNSADLTALVRWLVGYGIN